MLTLSGSLVFLVTLLAAGLAAVAALLALAVLVSFAIAWYDRVNADPHGDFRRHPALAARLLVTECAALLLTLLLRPCGWLPVRIGTRPARRPPVILLHGLFQNRGCLLALQWRLRAAGYDRVVSVNTPSWHNFDRLLDRVAATVETTRARSGQARVHLVGHSMGGILARSYLQLRDGARNVAACVTLGTPHAGSKLAPFAVSRHGRDLMPGSALLARLHEAPLPDQVAITAIRSRHDNLIVPPENAALAGATNIELTGLGHTALLFSGEVAQAVVAALTEDNR